MIIDNIASYVVTCFPPLAPTVPRLPRFPKLVRTMRAGKLANSGGLGAAQMKKVLATAQEAKRHT